jgi:hypothetical protein
LRVCSWDACSFLWANRRRNQSQPQKLGLSRTRILPNPSGSLRQPQISNFTVLDRALTHNSWPSWPTRAKRINYWLVKHNLKANWVNKVRARLAGRKPDY